MPDIAQSTTFRVWLKLYLSSDHVSDATGKTVAVTISKNGGAFGNPSAGVTNATEIANGWYYVDLSITDTATLGPLIVRGTSASCDNAERALDVVNANSGRLANLDTAISNAVTFAVNQILGVAGTTYYVAGGANDIVLPTVFNVGAPGSTTYSYQIIGHTSAAPYNLTGSTYGDAGATGARVGITTTGNATLNGTNYNTIQWTMPPGISNVDILKWSGSAWQSLALAQTGTSFNDQGGAASAYVVPTANTTSPGSDAANGKSWANAFATVVHAASVAVAGDKVILSDRAFPCQDNPLQFAAGVRVQGQYRDLTYIYSTLASANANFRAITNGYFADMTLDCSVADNAFRTGFGCALSDVAGVQNGSLIRCNVRGNSDAVFLGCNTTSDLKLYDCLLFATFDTCNILRGGVGVGHKVQAWNTWCFITGPDLQGSNVSRALSVSQAGNGTIEWYGGGGYVITPATATLAIGGGATGGTFTISVTAGGSTQTTAPITFSNALTATTIKTALAALSNVGANNAIVTGNVNGPWIISFTAAVGAWTATAANVSLSGGTPTISLTAAGAGSTNSGVQTNGSGVIRAIGAKFVAINFGGTAYDLQNLGGTIEVSGCDYNRLNTAGVITAIDNPYPRGLDFTNINQATAPTTLANITVPTVASVTDLAAGAQGDVQSALTAQGFTGARAAKLDDLDATVSSRSTLVAGAQMDLINAPNPTAITAIQNGLSKPGTAQTITMPAIPASWITAAGIAAGALNGKGDWLLSANYTAPTNLTPAQIATGVWQDAVAGDFTVAGSIGKSLFTSGAIPGAAGGLFIAGTNAATTVNFTGNLSGSVGSVTTMPAIPANWITAAGIAAGAFNGKGDWLLSGSYTAPDNADIVTALGDLVALLARSDTSSNINAIKAITDKLATMLQGAAPSTFTVAALANAPTGGGGGSAINTQVQITETEVGIK